MDGQTWLKRLSEPLTPEKLQHGKQRYLFVDICSSHRKGGDFDMCLSITSTKLHKFPANATHLLEPVDSFVIQKFKDVWRRLWDSHHLKGIKDGRFNDWSNSEASGKLVNPRKLFYFKLAAAIVREVNSQVDKDGNNYARKEMMRCGLSFDDDGVWSENMLSDDFKQSLRIIAITSTGNQCMHERWMQKVNLMRNRVSL